MKTLSFILLACTASALVYGAHPSLKDNQNRGSSNKSEKNVVETGNLSPEPEKNSKIRELCRPPFKSENIRINGIWINYRLPKPSHDGRLFITLDPLDFLERISYFIPYPRRHRRHFHGVFAPNSSLRKQVAASAQQRIENKARAM